MKKIHRCFLSLLFLLLATTISAQQQAVRGTVKDANGDPIIGASIIEKGNTGNGTITDLNGAFSLMVPANATLTVSYIGFIPQEVKAVSGSHLSVSLKEDTQLLEEVVIIGYGVQKRKDITGAVSSLSGDQFADIPVSDISKALAGRIPGLDVVSSGMNPGDVGNIQLRGKRSFVASNDPLIILDGMTYNGSLNDINPSDIQSIDVLKDASSTAIYGSKGANGVIIITTKRGQESRPKVTLESSVSVQKAFGSIPRLNSEQWVERYREALRASGTAESEIDNTIRNSIGETEWENYQNGISTNWQDLLLQSGWGQKHQLSLQGGTNKVRYFLAGNIYSQEGMIPTRRFERYSLRPNIDVSLTKNLKIGLSTLLSYTNKSSDIYYSTHVDQDAWADAVSLPPTATPYDKDGNFIFYPSKTAGYYINPLAELENDSYRWENKIYAAYINLYADWQVLPYLNYRLNLNADVRKDSDKSAADSDSNFRRRKTTYASVANNDLNHESIENILTFNKTFNEKHHLTVTAVHSYQQHHKEWSKIEVSDLPYSTSLWHNIGTASSIDSYASDMSEWKLLSFAGRVFYGFDERYLLTLSMRADGASQFAPGHKWGYFPSAAVAWRVSEESFMQGTKDWLSNLKLRLSYGKTGNQGISPYATQGSLSSTTYAFDETPALGMRPGSLGNQELKWETTAVYNIGLDFGFLNDRINGNIELYKSKTTDLLMYQKLPITTGFSEALKNIGSTENKGIEIALYTRNIETKDFQWNTDISFYLNREKIVKLYNGKVDDIGSSWFIGQPIDVWYDYKKIGIWQLGEETEAAKYGAKPGDLKIWDKDGKNGITDADRVILGSRQPDFVANLTNSFRYRDWDLSFDLYTRWGQTNRTKAFGQQSANNKGNMVVDYWTPTNPTNKYPRPNQATVGYTYGSSLNYRDGSFIRLKNLTLGYSLPKVFLKQLYIENARIYFTGQNLWYWSKAEYAKNNLEPEYSIGGDDYDLSFPAARTFTLGINVTF